MVSYNIHFMFLNADAFIRIQVIKYHTRSLNFQRHRPSHWDVSLLDQSFRAHNIAIPWHIQKEGGLPAGVGKSMAEI